MSADAIAAFWRWWPTVDGRLAELTGAGKPLPDELISEISERVAAIDHALEWELGPGQSSRRQFCLSSCGDRALRIVVERWLRAAPPPTGVWEFFPARQAGRAEGFELSIDGAVVAYDDFRFAHEVDEMREVVHLRAHHPAFAEMVDESLAVRATFITLDSVLGEDEVERWLGAVDIATEPLPSGLSLAELRDAVAELARTATHEQWAALGGETADGHPMRATINLALKGIDNLLFDMHVAIEVAIRDPTPDGLVDGDEAAVLDAAEDALIQALGDDGVYIGHETFDGKRVIHLHVAEAGPAASKIAAWTRHQSYVPQVHVEPDPGWAVLRWWR